jgi:hypothetical protein
MRVCFGKAGIRLFRSGDNEKAWLFRTGVFLRMQATAGVCEVLKLYNSDEWAWCVARKGGEARRKADGARNAVHICSVSVMFMEKR